MIFSLFSASITAPTVIFSIGSGVIGDLNIRLYFVILQLHFKLRKKMKNIMIITSTLIMLNSCGGGNTGSSNTTSKNTNSSNSSVVLSGDSNQFKIIFNANPNSQYLHVSYKLLQDNVMEVLKQSANYKGVITTTCLKVNALETSNVYECNVDYNTESPYGDPDNYTFKKIIHKNKLHTLYLYEYDKDFNEKRTKVDTITFN